MTIYMSAAMKVMPAVLLCWPVKSEADAGDVAVDIEPSCKYSVMFCCHMIAELHYQTLPIQLKLVHMLPISLFQLECSGS